MYARRIWFMLLPFIIAVSFTLGLISCSKEDEDEENTEIVDQSQDNSQEQKQNVNKKPTIRSLKVSYRKNGSKVSSSVSITATIQVEAPDDAPVTSVTISCEGKSASARVYLGSYTASLTVPGKAYGTSYTVKATATNKYGSYSSTTSFRRP